MAQKFNRPIKPPPMLMPLVMPNRDVNRNVTTKPPGQVLAQRIGRNTWVIASGRPK